MVELSGWLNKIELNTPRMAILKKAVTCLNNGQNVFFADYDYRTNDSAPEVWYLKTPHFSTLTQEKNMPLRTVAIFNLNDEPQDFEVDFLSLGLKGEQYFIKDVWSDACSIKDKISYSLAPHASALVMISEPNEMELLDSNLKINDICIHEGVMKLTFEYSGDFELTVSSKPLHINSVEESGVYKVNGKVGKDKTFTLCFSS